MAFPSHLAAPSSGQTSQQSSLHPSSLSSTAEPPTRADSNYDNPPHGRGEGGVQDQHPLDGADGDVTGFQSERVTQHNQPSSGDYGGGGGGGAVGGRGGDGDDAYQSGPGGPASSTALTDGTKSKSPLRHDHNNSQRQQHSQQRQSRTQHSHSQSQNRSNRQMHFAFEGRLASEGDPRVVAPEEGFQPRNNNNISNFNNDNDNNNNDHNTNLNANLNTDSNSKVMIVDDSVTPGQQQRRQQQQQRLGGGGIEQHQDTLNNFVGNGFFDSSPPPAALPAPRQQQLQHDQQNYINNNNNNDDREEQQQQQHNQHRLSSPVPWYETPGARKYYDTPEAALSANHQESLHRMLMELKGGPLCVPYPSRRYYRYVIEPEVQKAERRKEAGAKTLSLFVGSTPGFIEAQGKYLITAMFYLLADVAPLRVYIKENKNKATAGSVMVEVLEEDQHRARGMLHKRVLIDERCFVYAHTPASIDMLDTWTEMLLQFDSIGDRGGAIEFDTRDGVRFQVRPYLQITVTIADSPGTSNSTDAQQFAAGTEPVLAAMAGGGAASSAPQTAATNSNSTSNNGSLTVTAAPTPAPTNNNSSTATITTSGANAAALAAMSPDIAAVIASGARIGGHGGHRGIHEDIYHPRCRCGSCQRFKLDHGATAWWTHRDPARIGTRGDTPEMIHSQQAACRLYHEYLQRDILYMPVTAHRPHSSYNPRIETRPMLVLPENPEEHTIPCHSLTDPPKPFMVHCKKWEVLHFDLVTCYLRTKLVYQWLTETKREQDGWHVPVRYCKSHPKYVAAKGEEQMRRKEREKNRAHVKPLVPEPSPNYYHNIQNQFGNNSHRHHRGVGAGGGAVGAGVGGHHLHHHHHHHHHHHALGHHQFQHQPYQHQQFLPHHHHHHHTFAHHLSHHQQAHHAMQQPMQQQQATAVPPPAYSAEDIVQYQQQLLIAQQMQIQQMMMAANQQQQQQNFQAPQSATQQSVVSSSTTQLNPTAQGWMPASQQQQGGGQQPMTFLQFPARQ